MFFFSIQKNNPIFNELLWLFFVDQGEILEKNTHAHSWGDFLPMSTGGKPHFWKVSWRI